MFKTDVKTINSARPIIQSHYRLTSSLCNADVRAELLNLNRKADKGNMDDRQEMLHARLSTALLQTL